MGEVYKVYTCFNNVATLEPRKCVVFQTLLNDEAISAGDWQLIFGGCCQTPMLNAVSKQHSDSDANLEPRNPAPS
ncbi:hypothetical protein T11_10527 [Trichinella zimbabwensis]|uniref:Uncharacterized protein n=1 Tax=Trichinella zimbabwensis TaxID=268475 RepID=A0A0V1H9T6_9BILA|nr:hypothetical protein T11_10527 [Trichinella zimbabwensis]